MNELKKKAGPLPVWAWIAAVAVGLYFYHRNSSSGNNTASNTASAVDPSTGLPFSGESASGIPYLGGTGGGSDVGTGVTPSGTLPGLTPTTPSDTGTAPSGTPVDLTGGFLNQLQGFEQVQNALAGLGAYSQGLAGPRGPRGPAGKSPTTGHVNKGKGSAKKPPAKHVARTRKPATPAGQRTPATHNEPVHAPAPSHLREPAAHTRITVRTPAPPKPKPKPASKPRRR